VPFLFVNRIRYQPMRSDVLSSSPENPQLCYNVMVAVPLFLWRQAGQTGSGGGDYVGAAQRSLHSHRAGGHVNLAD
jgi:hypothetical protein